MEQLDIEEKKVSITFKITPSMNKAINKLMRKKKWRKSAFIRVAIEKELERIANENQ